ncbi:MAG: glucose 1-dehydrogenase [Nitrospinaceae bacterium]|jgi:NAD(P)-dependent dehydrogenase (short-subunit alcohol dehydrogenase family)|nr:glucose 1-dehydrogenase [Nitrospinaceae bacterium]MDP6735250.1 glucose 1-dehydrogenase [Nitrospinaceae bacterium]|tara:strand:+ start:2416 stop:3180 length:765 start_codon:yes stop_codon:yes gene_type:complete
MGSELFDIPGKVALVTGGTRGLGEVAAVAMAKAGAAVAVCGRSQPDLERVVRRITNMGGKAQGFFLDVLDRSKVNKTVADILDHFGQIDILVNNAGVNYRVPLLDFPEKEWDLIIDTNLKGYFLMAQAVVPGMLAHGYGKVINMSSVLGAVGLPMMAAYASSKGGVDQLTKVMALEWAKQGVRVNAIGPTYFETELVAQVRDDAERFNFINDRTPMGRWGHPSELEGIVIFLAAPASDFITGQTVYIDGGWTAW